MSMRPDPEGQEGLPMLLDVSDLVVDFSMTDGPTVHAVKGLDLQLPERGATAVIGESGSGKSVSMRAILGLLPSNAKISGSARLELGSGDTVELIGAGKHRLRRIRGREVRSEERRVGTEGGGRV